MANTTSNVIADLLAVADKHADEYEVAYNDMLAKRKAAREAANMVTSLSSVLGLPVPEFSPAVVKVLAKRKSRSGEDDDTDE